MKPFVVEMTICTVVMADDEHHAFSVARDAFRDIASDETPEVFVRSEVRGEVDLPDGWDLECLPYGGDGSTRLEALIPGAALSAGETKGRQA